MKKKYLLTGIIFFIAIRCYGQTANYIELENIGISPPSLPAITIIEETPFYFIGKRIAGVNITDNKTYQKTKEFIEKYKDIKSYSSSDLEFGVMEISIGTRTDTTNNIKEQYFTESRLRSGFFLEDLSKYLSLCECDIKIIRKIDYYIKSIKNW